MGPAGERLIRGGSVAIRRIDLPTGARLGGLLLLAIPLALTLWIYHPITRIFFFADDLMHLVEIENEGPLVFLLRPFGGNAFLARNLVFLATYRLFGFDPPAFQWTVLLTHLVNVWLLFGVLRVLTGSATLACFGAALWGVSPLALGSLGWYAAFGHVLAGTVVLVVLRSVIRVANADTPVPARTAALWYALLLAGSTCYGPGIGVALISPFVLLPLLPTAWKQPGVRWAFLALPAVTLGFYFGLRWLYSHVVGAFGLAEAVHQRLALLGLRHAPLFLGHSLLYSAAGTILAFFMPKAHPSPSAWMAFGALSAGVALVLWRGDAVSRRATLAMLALWLGTYGMIAGGRAGWYAALGWPLVRAAAVPRYHYLGTIPVVVLVCLALREVGRLGPLASIPRAFLLAAGLALLITGYRVNPQSVRIDERRYSRRMYERWVADVAAAVAAAPPGGVVYMENEAPSPAVLGPALPPRVVPGRATVVVVHDPAVRLEGREVRFIERNPDILDWYRDPERARTPLARLLVAPGEVPAGR